MKKIFTWRKTFFTIYLSQAFSLLSSSAVQFSMIWWITMETGSALALTIASVVGLLPQAIIGAFAGVWIDRFNRKKIMIFIEDMKQGILTIKSNKAWMILAGILMVFVSVLCYLLTREFDIPLKKESSVSGEKNHHATGDHLKNHIVLPGLRLIPF